MSTKYFSNLPGVIRHRLPDRMGQGVAVPVGNNPLEWGFYAPDQRVTAPENW